jgi:precorrin-2 dehydrogenase / sirohydrochlorin ferrochelatase
MAVDIGDGKKKEYPINLDLTGRRCLVIGGGSVAERKVAALLECGALITVMSPVLTAKLSQWGEQKRLTCSRQNFNKDAVDGYLLVFCATDSAEVNRQAAEAARRSGALVNVADTPALCDFTLPACHRQGKILVTVSTGGESPALARELRNELAGQYGPEYAAYLELAGRLRREWQRECESVEERCRRWREIRGFDPEVLQLLRQGRLEEAEVRFRHVVGGIGTQS